MNNVVFGQYYHSDSFFHKLDPRTKIISLLILMISIFLINNLYVLLGFLIFVLCLIAFSKVPIIKFLSSLKMMTMLFAFTIFFQVAFNNNGALIKVIDFNIDFINTLIILMLIIIILFKGKIIKKFNMTSTLVLIALAFFVQNKLNFKVFYNINYQISIYDEGLFTSLKIVLRIISLLFVSSLLTLTTKPSDLNNGLEWCLGFLKVFKIKVGIFSMMVSIALRFIPTLINETEKILKAQASRGASFKEGSLKNKIMQIVSLLIPMFVISFKKAEDLADAMEVRGYIPGEKRTTINKLEFKIKDIASFVFSFLLIGLIIYLKVRYAI